MITIDCHDKYEFTELIRYLDILSTNAPDDIFEGSGVLIRYEYEDMINFYKGRTIWLSKLYSYIRSIREAVGSCTYRNPEMDYELMTKAIAAAEDIRFYGSPEYVVIAADESGFGAYYVITDSFITNDSFDSKCGLAGKLYVNFTTVARDYPDSVNIFVGKIPVKEKDEVPSSFEELESSSKWISLYGNYHRVNDPARNEDYIIHDIVSRLRN